VYYFKTSTLAENFLNPLLPALWAKGNGGFVRHMAALPPRRIEGSIEAIKECKWREQVWIVDELRPDLQPEVAALLGFGEEAVKPGWVETMAGSIQKYEEPCGLRMTQIGYKGVFMEFSRPAPWSEPAQKELLRDTLGLNLEYFTFIHAPRNISEFKRDYRGKGHIRFGSI
jgi:hypothetical protein